MRAIELFIEGGEFDYDSQFFEPKKHDGAVIERVEAYVIKSQLERHEFFTLARMSASALLTWLSQELVMTNAFSQVVLEAASRIENVHVRAALSAVAFGEHGMPRNGGASRAHPTLLNRLRQTVGLQESEVLPLPPTAEFLRQLRETTLNPLKSVAAIGVGNERLIVPEYTAVWPCFEFHFPEAAFAPFLSANLQEDKVHARLCSDAARLLIHSREDEVEYENAAISSVDARMRYFDGLLAHVKSKMK